MYDWVQLDVFLLLRWISLKPDSAVMVPQPITASLPLAADSGCRAVSALDFFVARPMAFLHVTNPAAVERREGGAGWG